MATASVLELRRIRTAGIDDPERVVALGSSLLSKGAYGSAGEEYWNILDQVAVAAMETGNDDVAQSCLDKLSAQFPTSPRTYALLGMQLEAQEKLSEASEYYDYVLKEDQTNIMVWKRRVALLRSQNKSAEAINQLTLLLDTFPNDIEGWAELADLYISQDMLSQASFCLEELLLLQPFSYYVHAQYAEICWLLKKEATALKYWCRSVELCGDFLRGWFGVKTATMKLHGNGKHNTSNEDVEVPDLNTINRLEALAEKRLKELIGTAAPAEKTAVAKLLGDASLE